MSHVDVTDNLEAQRFEAHVAAHLAGYAEYQLTDALIVHPHRGGRGI